jgi:hypothetical protein
MPEHTDPTPEQSLSRREALKLAGAIAALGAALGVRPASSIAQGKEEGKTEGKAKAKTEGKAKAKTEGKAKAKGEGKGDAKAEGKAETKGEGKATGK